MVLDDVMGGRSNRVHLDAAAVKLDPPLSVVHAAEKLSGVGDCYDGGRLSLTGFFQLWAVALDGLATEVCRSSSQSQAKTDEVATLVHRHRKCVAVLLDVLLPLGYSFVVHCDCALYLAPPSSSDNANMFWVASGTWLRRKSFTLSSLVDSPPTL